MRVNTPILMPSVSRGRLSVDAMFALSDAAVAAVAVTLCPPPARQRPRPRSAPRLTLRGPKVTGIELQLVCQHRSWCAKRSGWCASPRRVEGRVEGGVAVRCEHRHRDRGRDPLALVVVPIGSQEVLI